MNQRTLKLPPDSYDFVRTRIESGRYENPSHLIQAAFRALHREEKQSENKIPAPSIAEGDVFRKLWETSAQHPVDRRKVPRPD